MRAAQDSVRLGFKRRAIEGEGRRAIKSDVVEHERIGDVLAGRALVDKAAEQDLRRSRADGNRPTVPVGRERDLLIPVGRAELAVPVVDRRVNPLPRQRQRRGNRRGKSTAAPAEMLCLNGVAPDSDRFNASRRSARQFTRHCLTFHFRKDVEEQPADYR